MRSDRDEAVAAAGFLVRQRHQRAAARVAEQHDGFRAAPPHLVDGHLHVDDQRFVQAVGVVVEVARTEAEDGVAGGG